VELWGSSALNTIVFTGKISPSNTQYFMMYVLDQSWDEIQSNIP
jgi:hypothetical protein